MQKTPWIDRSSPTLIRYFNPFKNQHTIHTTNRNAEIFVSNNARSTDWTHKVCPLCFENQHLSTPNKSIVISEKNAHQFIDFPAYPHHYNNVLFHQQGNLFEVIDRTYWENTYQLTSSEQTLEQIKYLLQDSTTRTILLQLIQQKLDKIDEQIVNFNEDQLQQMIVPFYEGFHELIVSGKHYHDDNSTELFHSGKITWQEHRIMLEMIIRSMERMYHQNPYLQFIAIYQNWQHQAGASLEHWHKQILGIDFWGEHLLREAQLFAQNNNIFREFVATTLTEQELFICENEHAIAYVEIGGKAGQITICSKSSNLFPFEHTKAEQQAMSDLTHAILTTFTPMTPYNEEWFYTPFHQDDFKTPWRITLNIRTNIVAGFENITDIYINPICPSVLAKKIRKELQGRKNIAPEVSLTSPLNFSKNILQYIQR